MNCSADPNLAPNIRVPANYGMLSQGRQAVWLNPELNRNIPLSSPVSLEYPAGPIASSHPYHSLTVLSISFRHFY